MTYEEIKHKAIWGCIIAIGSIGLSLVNGDQGLVILGRGLVGFTLGAIFS